MHSGPEFHQQQQQQQNYANNSRTPSPLLVPQLKAPRPKILVKQNSVSNGSMPHEMNTYVNPGYQPQPQQQQVPRTQMMTRMAAFSEEDDYYRNNMNYMSPKQQGMNGHVLMQQNTINSNNTSNDNYSWI